jgi:exopolysaccharide biosynthesis WecB/TagA/CpsF family protein
MTRELAIIDVVAGRLSNAPGESGLTTFLNPYSYLYFRRAADLLLPFDHICVDGSGLVVALRSIGLHVSRSSFDYGSIAHDFLEGCSASGRSVAIVGAPPGNHEIAVDMIRKRHSGLRVIASRHGYFSGSQERLDFVRHLRDSAPDVVVAGLGTPLQEIFLTELRSAGWRGLGVTCGGFLYQTSIGRGDYYPKWANRPGLRALYRAMHEPHVRDRLVKDYPRFPFCFASDFAAARLRGIGRRKVQRSKSSGVESGATAQKLSVSSGTRVPASAVDCLDQEERL